MLILGIFILVIGIKYRGTPTTGKRTALLVLSIITAFFAFMNIISLFSTIATLGNTTSMISELYTSLLKEMGIRGTINLKQMINSIMIFTVVLTAIDVCIGIGASIFGFITYANKNLASRAVPKNAYQNNTPYAGTKICASCGQTVVMNAYACPRCGGQVFNQPNSAQASTAYTTQAPQQNAAPQQPVQQPQQAAAPATYEWFCPNCGQNNSSANNFCSSCGTRNPNLK